MNRFGAVRQATPLLAGARGRCAAVVAVWILTWLVLGASAAQIRVPYDQPTIQAGIDAATTGDVVIVYPNRYRERINLGGRNITVRSTDPTSAAVVASTVLDAASSGSVVTFGGSELSTCVLAGFTITGGYAFRGGGISGNGTHATIRNNIISTNTVTRSDCWGGGLADCHGLIENNLITSNVAQDLRARGAGLYNCDGLIHNNSITNNKATGWSDNIGGGLCECDGIIRNNVIAGNSATAHWVAYGGGLCSCDGVIENNRIAGNSTTSSGADAYGGGLGDCNGTIEGNVISGNWVRGGRYSYGGGLSACSGFIQNNIVSQNSCSADNLARGGGMWNCSGVLRNNTIWGNTSGAAGGGLSDCTGEIRNCILWQNTAPTSSQLYQCSTPSYSSIQYWRGGGVENIASDPFLKDPAHGDFHLRGYSPCIDAGGTVPLAMDIDGETRPRKGAFPRRGDGTEFDIGADEASSMPLSIAFDPTGLSTIGVLGNNAATQTVAIWNPGSGTLAYTIDTTPSWLVASPLFGSSAGPASGTVHTISYQTASLPLGDYGGAITITDPAAPNSPVRIPVRLSVRLIISRTFTVGPGESFDHRTIQAAINATTTGDIVIVYPNTYRERIRFGRRNITVRSTDPTSPAVVAATIIDGSGPGPAVGFSGSESSGCVLSGFTITGGRALYGGGICGYGTHATIRYNVITGNSVWHQGWAEGGGLYDCDGLIEYNTIARNSASADNYCAGGGLSRCDGTIRHNAITSNSATAPEGEGNAGGGGLYRCDGTIEDNLISGNSSSAANRGGGSALCVCNGTIQRNVITRNRSHSGGFGAPGSSTLEYCGGTIQNNIIAGNSSDGDMAVGLKSCSAAILNNTIVDNYEGRLWDCHGTIRNNIISDGLDNCSTPSYCYFGDPRLVNRAGGDFHLRWDSPCIDAGGSVTLTEDFEGDRRPYDFIPSWRGDGSNFDIGADEFILSSPFLAASVVAYNIWAAPGTDAATRTLTVWNAGPGRLSYTVTTTAGWLSASPSSAVSDGPASRTAHSIRFRTAALAVGNYAATITLTAAGVANSPMVIPLSLLIAVPPVCTITQPSTRTICVAGEWTTVAWTCVNNPNNDRFYLSIWKDGQLVRNWTSVACHNGQNQVRLLMPTGLPRAAGYRLRLSWLVNYAVYYESGPIIITDSLPFLGVPWRHYRLYR